MLQPLALQLGLDGCNIGVENAAELGGVANAYYSYFSRPNSPVADVFHPRKVIVCLFILLTIPSWSIPVQRISFMLQEGSHCITQEACRWQAVAFRDKMPLRSEDVVPCFDSAILSRGLPSLQSRIPELLICCICHWKFVAEVRDV
jgi:hypothetical protein